MNSIPLWKFIREDICSNTPCTLLLAVETQGSGPGRPGAAMVVASDGKTRGTVGGGIMEHQLVNKARKMLESGIGSPELITCDHTNENGNSKADRDGIPSGMICSGSQITAVFPIHQRMLETVSHIISILEAGKTGTLYLSGIDLSVSDSFAQETHEFSMAGGNNWEYSGPLGLRDTVYIIGGGHVGQALAHLLAGLSFRSVIIDKRERNSFEDPPSCRWITAPYEEAYNYIPDGNHSWVVIMTPFHRADTEVLESLAGKDLKYAGMMASGSKKEKVYSDLVRKGVPEEFLNSVHCPIGISIGSRTPNEIAVSIAAQLIGVSSCIRSTKEVEKS